MQLQSREPNFANPNPLTPVRCPPALSAKCPVDRPKVFTPLSGSKLKWIQESLCKFSDFSSNCHFCPELICPPDLFLIQDDNSTTMGGGAFLPQVNGSQLKPALIDVTQFPLAGEARDQNTVTVVTVTGANPSTNQTLSCQWRVTVQNIDNNLDGWYVWFTANNGNTNYMESFDLQYPVLGKFFGVGSMTFLYNYAMTLRSSLTATLKRINASHATDSSVLQTIRVRGNNVSDFVEYSDNPVSFPDYRNRY